MIPFRLRLWWERRKLAITEWWHSTTPVDLDELDRQAFERHGHWRPEDNRRVLTRGFAPIDFDEVQLFMQFPSDYEVQGTVAGRDFHLAIDPQDGPVFVSDPEPKVTNSERIRRGLNAYAARHAETAWAPPTEEQDPDDDCFEISGRPYQYGRCDDCGQPDAPWHSCHLLIEDHVGEHDAGVQLSVVVRHKNDGTHLAALEIRTDGTAALLTWPDGENHELRFLPITTEGAPT